MEMKYTKLRTKRRFSITRNFIRSRFEAEYLAKAYEIVVPIYKKEYLKQKEQNRDNSETEIATYRQFGIGG